MVIEWRFPFSGLFLVILQQSHTAEVESLTKEIKLTKTTLEKRYTFFRKPPFAWKWC